MRYYEKITIESAFANAGLMNLHLFLEFIFFSQWLNRVREVHADHLTSSPV